MSEQEQVKELIDTLIELKGAIRFMHQYAEWEIPNLQEEMEKDIQTALDIAHALNRQGEQAQKSKWDSEWEAMKKEVGRRLGID